MVGTKINNKKISVAIPTFNSSKFITSALDHIRGDDRVDDIVVMDDGSSDFGELLENCRNIDKLGVVGNDKNIGGFWNKHRAVEACKNDWVIVLDSDNSLSKTYVDTLYNFKCIYKRKNSDRIWDEDVIYCPEFGDLRLDYTFFSDTFISKENIVGYLKNYELLTRSLLNTGNYFVNKSKFLETTNPGIKGHVPCSIALTYLWLSRGFKLKVVKDLRYIHRFHSNSYWKRNHKTMQVMVDGIINSLLEGESYDF